MKKGKLIFGLSILAIIAILAYVKIGKNKEAKAKQSPMMGMSGKMPALAVDGFLVEYSKLADNISANGNILAQDEVQLQPEVSGRVTYLNIKEGAFVAKGTLLLKINDADLQAQVAKLKTQVKIAQTNFNRLAELLKIKGVSQAEYDAAENTLNNIKADIQILQAQIDKTELRAPFSGKLGLRNISLGAMVSPTTIVTSLQNTSQLKIDVAVPEKYASLLHLGDVMSCKIAGINEPVLAKVAAIDPVVDEMTRNLKVRAVLLSPNAKIVPGSYVKVEVKLKEIPNSIVIPSSAIIPDDKSTKVVIVGDSSKAQFVNVEVGVRTENSVQILSGLKLGDTVLTTGLLQVRPGMEVKIRKAVSNSTIQ